MTLLYRRTRFRSFWYSCNSCILKPIRRFDLNPNVRYWNLGKLSSLHIYVWKRIELWCCFICILLLRVLWFSRWFCLITRQINKSWKQKRIKTWIPYTDNSHYWWLFYNMQIRIFFSNKRQLVFFFISIPLTIHTESTTHILQTITGIFVLLFDRVDFKKHLLLYKNLWKS